MDTSQARIRARMGQIPPKGDSSNGSPKKSRSISLNLLVSRGRFQQSVLWGPLGSFGGWALFFSGGQDCPMIIAGRNISVMEKECAPGGVCGDVFPPRSAYEPLLVCCFVLAGLRIYATACLRAIVVGTEVGEADLTVDDNCHICAFQWSQIFYPDRSPSIGEH